MSTRRAVCCALMTLLYCQQFGTARADFAIEGSSVGSVTRDVTGGLFDSRLDRMQDPGLLFDLKGSGGYVTIGNPDQLSLGIDLPLGPGHLGAYLSSYLDVLNIAENGTSDAGGSTLTDSYEIRQRALDAYLGYGLSAGALRLGVGVTGALRSQLTSAMVQEGGAYSCPGYSYTEVDQTGNTVMDVGGVCRDVFRQPRLLVTANRPGSEGGQLGLGLFLGQRKQTHGVSGQYWSASEESLDSTVDSYGETEMLLVGGRLRLERPLTQTVALDLLISAQHARGTQSSEETLTTGEESYALLQETTSPSLSGEQLVRAGLHLKQSSHVDVRLAAGAQRLTLWGPITSSSSGSEKSEVVGGGQSAVQKTQTAETIYDSGHTSTDGFLILAAGLSPVDWLTFYPGIRLRREWAKNVGCQFDGDGTESASQACFDSAVLSRDITRQLTDTFDYSLGMDVQVTPALTFAAAVSYNQIRPVVLTGWDELYSQDGWGGTRIEMSYRW